MLSNSRSNSRENKSEAKLLTSVFKSTHWSRMGSLLYFIEGEHRTEGNEWNGSTSTQPDQVWKWLWSEQMEPKASHQDKSTAHNE